MLCPSAKGFRRGLQDTGMKWEWLNLLTPTRAVSPSHMYLWPPCGLLPSTACFSIQTHPHSVTFLPIGSGYFRAKPFPVQIPQHSQPQLFFIPTCLWRWNRQCVPKCWHIKFRRWGITQKKAYNIQNMAKVWNQDLWDVFVMDWVLFLHVPAVRPSWWIVFVPHFKQWRLPRARILYRNIILSDKCH
jgi:hypothetical protein